MVVVVVVGLVAPVVDGAAGLVVTVRVTTGGGANRFSQPAIVTAITATVTICARDLPVTILSFSFPCRTSGRRIQSCSQYCRPGWSSSEGYSQKLFQHS